MMSKPTTQRTVSKSEDQSKPTCQNCGKILEERDKAAYGSRCEDCYIGDTPGCCSVPVAMRVRSTRAAMRHWE
jgi:hypothetical protein